MGIDGEERADPHAAVAAAKARPTTDKSTSDQRTGTCRLRPIDLGNGVVIERPVILAPMSGVTDLPFRTLARRLGAGLVVSEMIASWAMVRENAATLRMAETVREPDADASAGTARQPNAVQLAGCEPEAMAEAARIAVGRGADIVDINFGCPVKKVAVGQMAGSALMRDETLAARLLEATVRAVPVPVTLKMRMGWDHGSLNAPAMARIAEASGIRMLTVHGRTRQQFYTGRADWDFVARVKRSTRLPVIVNGDILTAADAERALACSGADGVMIGRGCYGRPWLPALVARVLDGHRDARAPTLEQERAIVLEHYRAMLHHFGRGPGLRLARKHVSWYSHGLPGSAGFRAAINRVDDDAVAIGMLCRFWDEAIEHGATRDGRVAVPQASGTTMPGPATSDAMAAGSMAA